MSSINDDILYGIDNSINNEKAKYRIKQEREKLDYEKQYYIKEIERLNNIINELEKWLNEEYDATIFDYHNAIEDVIDKLIELKGSE